MSWTCPACQNAIRHSEVETSPRSGVTYRCPICRLELVVDLQSTKMVLAPLPYSDDHEPVLKRRATSPAGSESVSRPGGE